ncbi:unnamed protein product [Cutaneotrichosporon oleaginosum]
MLHSSFSLLDRPQRVSPQDYDAMTSVSRPHLAWDGGGRQALDEGERGMSDERGLFSAPHTRELEEKEKERKRVRGDGNPVNPGMPCCIWPPTHLPSWQLSSTLIIYSRHFSLLTVTLPLPTPPMMAMPQHEVVYNYVEDVDPNLVSSSSPAFPRGRQRASAEGFSQQRAAAAASRTRRPLLRRYCQRETALVRGAGEAERGEDSPEWGSDHVSVLAIDCRQASSRNRKGRGTKVRGLRDARAAFSQLSSPLYAARPHQGPSHGRQWRRRPDG